MDVLSRSPDDRRRRRLVTGGHDNEDNASPAAARPGLTQLLQRSLSTGEPIPVPGLPQSTVWHGVLLALAYVAVGCALWWSMWPTPLPEPGDRLLVLLLPAPAATAQSLELLGWGSIVLLVGLIGWSRRGSQVDFKGQYRVWSWAFWFAVAVLVEQLADPHHAGLTLALDLSQRTVWQPALLCWLVPLIVVGGPIAWYLANDLRGSATSLWLFRIAVTLCVTGIGLREGGLLMALPLWAEPAAMICQVLAEVTFVLTFWTHLRHVVYVDPNPPAEPAAGTSTAASIWGWLLRWLAPAPSTAEPETPTKRKRKTAEAKSDGAETPAKKPRKKTTRKRRTTKAAAAAEEADGSDSGEMSESGDGSEWSEEDSGGEVASEESSTDGDSAGEESESTEDDWSRYEEPAPQPAQRDRGTDRRSASSSRTTANADDDHEREVPAQRPRASVTAATSSTDEDYDSGMSEDDEDGDSQSLRADGAHGSGGDPFRGLSKRQRRELKRQLRQQGG